jgi:hypothetical protein
MQSGYARSRNGRERHAQRRGSVRRRSAMRARGLGSWLLRCVTMAALACGGRRGPTTPGPPRAVASSPADESRSAPVSEPAAGASPTAVATGAPSDSEANDLAFWQGRLGQAEAAFASAGSACEQMCRASNDICVASREICTITGEEDAPAARDSRCARTRAACDQVIRQRGISCPACSP